MTTPSNTPDGFLRVAQVAEVPPGSLRTITIAGEAVLIANVDGRYYAMGAICKHAEWDLAEGMLEGTKVICAGHGAIWELQTGLADFPEPLEPEPVYEVQVVGDTIYVRARSFEQR